MDDYIKALDEAAAQFVAPLIERIDQLEAHIRDGLIAQAKDKWSDKIEPLKGAMDTMTGHDVDVYANIVDSDLSDEDVESSIDQLKQIVINAAKQLEPNESVDVSQTEGDEHVHVEATKADTGEIIVETTVSSDTETEKTVEVVSDEGSEKTLSKDDFPKATQDIISASDANKEETANDREFKRFNKGGKAYKGIGSYFKK